MASANPRLPVLPSATHAPLANTSPFNVSNLNALIVKVKSLSRVQHFAIPWTVAYQAPPSMGFSRQEYWSGLPFPSPGDLPDPVMEPRSPTLQADALLSEPPGKTHTVVRNCYMLTKHIFVKNNVFPNSIVRRVAFLYPLGNLFNMGLPSWLRG